MEQPALPNGLHKDATPNGLPQTDSSLDSDSDDFAQDSAQEAAMQDGEDGSNSAYNSRQPSGAPQPLEPQLVTLSLLPRSQWQSLVHLEAIKVGQLTCELTYVCLAMMLLFSVFAQQVLCCVSSAKGRAIGKGWVRSGIEHMQLLCMGSHCIRATRTGRNMSASLVLLVMLYA